MADSKPKLVIEDVTPIAKPDTAFSLDKFKSKRAAALANVETLQMGLPHHNIAQAKDFVRLHPDEANYWSSELCFANVPIKGQKRDTLHLIDERLALRYLPSGKIMRLSLALATKPNDKFSSRETPSHHRFQLLQRLFRGSAGAGQVGAARRRRQHRAVQPRRH